MDDIRRTAWRVARASYLDLAALGGMVVGGQLDTARFGPLGIMAICGDPRAGLLMRIDAHLFSYGVMLAAFALAARAGGAGQRCPPWRLAIHALAMCAGMAAADLAMPVLPGPPTPWLTFLAMTLGMMGGSLAARVLAGPPAGRIGAAATR